MIAPGDFSVKKVSLNLFPKFIGKQLWKLWASNFIKKRLQNGFYSAHFEKLLEMLLNEVSKHYFLVKVIGIKIEQLKLKCAKIYIYENQKNSC